MLFVDLGHRRTSVKTTYKTFAVYSKKGIQSIYDSQIFRRIKKKCMRDEKVFGSTRPVLPVQLNADF